MQLILCLLILITFSCQEFDTNIPDVAIEESDVNYVAIDQGRPVVLAGSGTTVGHMWVTDGYLRAVFCSGQTLLKLQMNWGWGGLGNGLFNYDNFSVTINGTTHSFNNNKYMIYNIVP